MSSALITVLSNVRIALSYGPAVAFILLLRIVVLLFRQDIEDRENRITGILPNHLRPRYDFIVVGSGSAGAILANRLSELPDVTVLLIEAGGEEPVLSDLPLLYSALQTTPIDWQYKTEPSNVSNLAMKGNKSNWPRGKVLGGTSVLNAMLYIRGNKKDYDSWEAMGNHGWSYKDVLPYFKKSEDFRVNGQANKKYHGKGGLISVEELRYYSPITESFLKAGEEYGYDSVDVNGAKQTGFTKSHCTLNQGLRCSTAKGFLRPIRNRRNLDIILHSHVEKVIVEKMDGEPRAVGVVFSRLLATGIKAYAKKDVILSAGTINSPQLLMLSGIGPKDHLEEMSIPVVKHLPGVGQNLQDHIAMGGVNFLVDSQKQSGGSKDAASVLPRFLTIETLQKFATYKSGPLYALPTTEAMAFVNTKYANASDDYPDIQLLFASAGDNTDGGIFGKRNNGLKDEFYAHLYEPILYRDTVTIAPLLLRPQSKGLIRLRDNNPKSHPIIVTNYFDHPQDIEVMIEGAKIGYSLTQMPAFHKYNAFIHDIPCPGCSEFRFLSDDYWRCQASSVQKYPN